MVRLLCLTVDSTLIRQVSAIFSDTIVNLACHATLNGFLKAHDTHAFNACFIDFDAVNTEPLNPMQLFDLLGAGSKIIIVASSTLTEWQSEIRNRGAIFLHKPITAGEVGLALRRLMIDAPAQNGGS